MATLEENIQKVANLKSNLQTQFDNLDIDYTGVMFEDYGNIIRDNMEKVLIEQSKDIKPTTSTQIITPDDGYKLTQVNVEAIQVEQKEVKSSSISQTIISSSGKFISEITVQPLDLETKIITPTTSQQAITPSQNKDGINEVIVNAVTNSIDENIVASNIKKDVSILGVTGTFEGGIQPTETLEIITNGTYDVTDYALANVNVEGGAESNIDTSDTTTTPEDVLEGFDFYNNQSIKATGTIQTMSGGTFTSNQILNTANKYLTDDIVINVPDGDTRLEDDTIYKMKAVDTMMYELRGISLSEIPFESEYIEQQKFINDVIDSTKFNVTNFINYITTTCVDELKHNLNFKNQYCKYTQNFDSLIGQTSNIGIFGSKPYLESTAPLTGVTATSDKVRLGRLFYDANGNATHGNITSIIGRDIDINQTLPTAGKYLTDNINIQVVSGGKNNNETLKEMVAIDNLLYNLRFMENQYITDEEYLQQQEFINNAIYEIQGVEF